MCLFSLGNTGRRPKDRVIRDIEGHRDTKVGIQYLDIEMFLYRLFSEVNKQ